jgi:hypothetical protein
MQYYYLITALPVLKFDSDLPINMDEFIELCRQELTEKDFIKFSTASGCQLSSEFEAWDIALKNELVKLRASRLGFDADESLKQGGIYAGLAELAREIFNQENPLEAELLLDRMRWNKISELEALEYFSMEKLAAYLLKLKLLKRKALFTKENGNENYKQIYETVTGSSAV